MIVSWFSAGVSSAVATKLALMKYDDVKIIYTHIEDQHPDTIRFVKDCEKWFGQEIEINQSPLKSVDNACRQSGFVKSPFGAPCTNLLKRRVRKEWEQKNGKDHYYVWGFDFNEQNRADRLAESMPEQFHVFPLMERSMIKKEVHGIIEKSGIKRPAMYDLGYPNNNCIGCLKGGMGYWNKIRQDFPEVFESRCQMEEITGGRIFKEFSLRDLPEDRGRKMPIIVPDCGLFCELSAQDARS